MKISVVTPSHDPQFLGQVWESLAAQTHQDFEWVVALNGKAETAQITNDDPRVRFARPFLNFGASVGAIKAVAFKLATGDVVLELDHDDLLAPTALERCAEAFADPVTDFVYSECADFPDPPGNEPTYFSMQARAAWMQDGWRFGECEVPQNLRAAIRADKLPHPVCFEPSALALSLILYAPNHFRAWRRSFYDRIGGHSMGHRVCDDLELLQRTFLAGRMTKISEVLYFYRVRGDAGNTWLQNAPLIQKTSEELRDQNLHKLVAREMELRGLPCLDLGGKHGSPGSPWIPFDKSLPWPEGAPHIFDGLPLDALSTRLPTGAPWPFPDSSIGAFRAADFLEHLPNKLHTMSEIYRCLAPGGWLLSSTPDAMGPGAHQDPTHCSYWVENSFRYYTEERLARYIDNTTERFMASRLFTQRGEIPYVVADLVSLKEDDGRLPSRRRI